MEDTIEEKNSEYQKIIWNYIDAVSTQMDIVPVSYNILSAQMLTESRKVEKYRKEHGVPFKDEEGGGFNCL